MSMGIYVLLRLVCVVLATTAFAECKQLAKPMTADDSEYVPCTRNIFEGTTFYGAERFDEAVQWIKRNQLLVEGISPMVSMRFVNVTDSYSTVTTKAIFDTTGPLNTKAASLEPLFLQPKDAGCSLGRANAQYKSAHPTGPELIMGSSVLTGVVNNEIGAWQPQGFFAKLESVADGLLFKAQRLYDDGDRENPVRSQTKAITSATFMALAERGFISLDDQAGKFVPAFSRPTLAAITFRMLLSHISGLPTVIDKGEALVNPEITLMESATIIADTYTLVCTPGTCFAYTELGYQVIGAAMEAATGKSFQSLVEKYITGPMGMDNTNVYNQWKLGFSTNPNCAFGGVSSPNDIRIFMGMLLAGGVATCKDGKERRILSQASVDEMVTPQPLSEAFGVLINSDLQPFILGMLQTGLIDNATAAVFKTLFGDAHYGFGIPLTQVTGGKARNVLLVGSSSQVSMILNYQDPERAMITDSSCFQDYWLIAACVNSVILAAVLP